MICAAPTCRLQLPDGTPYDYDRCPGCLLQEAILGEVKPGDRVIDCGHGLAAYGPALYAKLMSDPARPGELVVLDAHALYLLKRRLPPDVTQVVGVLPGVLSLFASHRFDVALAIDVPEHLEAPAALELLVQQRYIASKAVWFIPEGHHPQDSDPSHMGADRWQTHRTTWEPSPDGLDLVGKSEGHAPRKLPHPTRSVHWPTFHAFEGLPGSGKQPPGSTGAYFAVWGG